MKVFLTGGTGFVGSALARELAAGGADLRVLVRARSDRSRLAGLPVEWVEGDLLRPATYVAALQDVDWVVHAAGMLGRAGVPESAYHQLHGEGTRHLLAAAGAAGSRPVLHVSSPGVLGPIRGEAADEAAPLAPSNPYERSKAAAERLALGYGPAVIVRPEFIYGPGDTHVLGLFCAVRDRRFFFVGRGAHCCHPTYIDDAVRGMLLCMEKGRPGQIYHIAGPRPVTFRELAGAMARALAVAPPWLMIPRPLAWLGASALELLGAATGRVPPLTRSAVAFFGESRRFSWQKAHRELGYEPGWELPAGIEATVAWYRQEGLI